MSRTIISKCSRYFSTDLDSSGARNLFISPMEWWNCPMAR